MRYVTRERVHVDRIATAWAIRRFIDPEATFALVPRTHALSDKDGVAFDVRGAELSHRDERCTFEVLLETRHISDPAAARMALIVRGADLPHQDGAPPESSGVRAVFDALRDTDMTDDDRVAKGSVICDALYAHCAAR
ncbi:MAG TPA: chromate resistance protein ChrB domain-containing protein [Candidatus Limnocylindrales bacterium]|nr:chromate resistance protein ChrB domain-containing protein [Candidatus Limnocylindrales bacterium]